jgi:hypothetical protein
MGVKIKTVIRRVIAVLKLQTRISKKIEQFKNIWSMAQASTWMAGVTWPTGVTAAIADLDAKQVKVATRVPGAVEERDTAMRIVLQLVRNIIVIVQAKADADPENAEAMILDCGLKVKTVGQINKQDFELRNGKVSGQVILLAHRKESRSFHEWGISTDASLTWDDLPTTMGSRSIANKLKRGSIVSFRHREVNKNGEMDWEMRDIVVL